MYCKEYDYKITINNMERNLIGEVKRKKKSLNWWTIILILVASYTAFTFINVLLTAIKLTY